MFKFIRTFWGKKGLPPSYEVSERLIDSSKYPSMIPTDKFKVLLKEKLVNRFSKSNAVSKPVLGRFRFLVKSAVVASLVLIVSSIIVFAPMSRVGKPTVPFVKANENAVAVNFPIRFIFPYEKISTESLRKNFSITPDAKGELTFEKGILSFNHERNLKYGTKYLIKIAREASGIMPKDFILPFSTRPRMSGEFNIFSGMEMAYKQLNYYDSEKEMIITMPYAGRFKATMYKISPDDLSNFLSEYGKAYSEGKTDPKAFTKSLKKNAVDKQDVVVKDEVGKETRLVYAPKITDSGLYFAEIIGEAQNDYDSGIFNFFVSYSRYAVSVKRLGTKLVAWVVDMKSAAGVQSARVVANGLENKVLFEGFTDASGVAQFTVPGDAASLPYALTVETGNEKVMNIINIRNRSIFESDWQYAAKPFVGYIFTNRPLYSPGDMAKFKVFLRKNGEPNYDGSIKNASVEVAFDQYGIPGQTIFKKDYQPSSVGTFAVELPLGNELKTGDYRISVKVGDTEAVSEYFGVEVFQKPEFEVSLNTDNEKYISGQDVKVDVDSKYFFGGPVNKQKVTVEVISLFNDQPFATKEGMLDGSGRFTAVFPNLKLTNENIPWDYYGDNGFMYLVKAQIRENTGKNVIASRLITIYPSEYKVEIESPSELWNLKPRENIPFIFKVTRVLDSGEMNGQEGVGLSLNFVRKIWTKKDGLITERAFEKDPVVKTDSFGKAYFDYEFPVGGTYDLNFSVVDSKGNVLESSKYFWIPDNQYGITYDQSLPASNVQIMIVPNKEKYSIGDKALFRAYLPQEEGQIYLSSNTNGLRKVWTQKITDDVVDIEVPITEDLVPSFNLFAEVFNGDAFLTGSRFVDVEGKKISIEITPSTLKAYPKEEITLSVMAKDADGNPIASEGAISVIDKAILALRSYKEKTMFDVLYPKPSQYAMSRITSADSFAIGAAEKGGGPGGADARPRKDFLDTAYWNAFVETGSDGRGEVKFTLPDNLTTWVALGKNITRDTDVGEGQGELTVSKDLFVRPNLPLFFRTGDEADITASIHNTTANNLKVKANLKVEGAKILDNVEKELEIAAGDSAQVVWKIGIGEAKEVKFDFAVAQVGGNSVDNLVQKLPVYFSKSLNSKVFSGSAPTDVSFDTYDSATVTIMSSVVGVLPDVIAKLTGYPYGCVEQTMSKHLPNMLVKKNGALFGITKPKDIDDTLKSGFERLQKFQHDDGSFGWWETDPASIWMTGFVLEGFMEIKDLGLFEGYEGMYQKTVDYLKGVLPTLKGNEKIYANYVLSRAVPKEFLPVIDDKELAALQPEFLGYVALTHYFNGNLKEAKRVVTEFLMKDFADDHWEQADNSYDGHDMSMSDKYMATGVNLSALMTIGGATDSQIKSIVKWLMDHRNGYEGLWGSTRQSSQVLFALTKYITKYNELAPNFSYKVAFNGGKLAAGRVSNAKFKKKIEIPLKNAVEKNTLRVDYDGTGSLYYTVQLKNHVDAAASAQVPDSVIKLTRTFKKNGVAVNEFSVGDVLNVELNVEAGKPLSYLMVEDYLSAGFDVINDRLSNDESMLGEDYFYWEDPMDVRDQRVTMFRSSVNVGNNLFTYRVRVSRTGNYSAPASFATPMYDPAITAMGLAEKVKILP